MASVNVIIFLPILLALQSTTTTSDILPPLLSPIFGLFMTLLFVFLFLDHQLPIASFFSSGLSLFFIFIEGFEGWWLFDSLGLAWISNLVANGLWFWRVLSHRWVFLVLWCVATDEVCKAVECGKGTCKPSNDSSLFFECECDPGWMQTRPAHDDHLKFLPCVIPNCESLFLFISASFFIFKLIVEAAFYTD